MLNHNGEYEIDGLTYKVGLRGWIFWHDGYQWIRSTKPYDDLIKAMSIEDKCIEANRRHNRAKQTIIKESMNDKARDDETNPMVQIVDSAG
jgi:hypothetical protein